MIDILVVEDSPTLRKLAGFWLERAGLTVEVADSVKEANRLLRARPPRLVLLDMDLPDGTGMELLRVLPEEIQNRTLFVASSGAELNPRDRELFALEISKPYSFPAMVEALRELLGEGPATAAQT